jgi:hypothetical protein
MRNVPLILTAACGGVFLIAAVIGVSRWWSEDGQFSDARQAVSASMIDPHSTQFRNLRKIGPDICGEVNAKNRMGAYVGYTPFLYRLNQSRPVVLDTDPHTSGRRLPEDWDIAMLRWSCLNGPRPDILEYH